MANRNQSLALAKCLFARNVQSLSLIWPENLRKVSQSVLNLSSSHVVATVILLWYKCALWHSNVSITFWRPKALPSEKMTRGEWKKRWRHVPFLHVKRANPVANRKVFSSSVEKTLRSAIPPRYFFKAKQMEAKLELLRRTMDVDASCCIEFPTSWF